MQTCSVTIVDYKGGLRILQVITSEHKLDKPTFKHNSDIYEQLNIVLIALKRRYKHGLELNLDCSRVTTRDKKLRDQVIMWKKHKDKASRIDKSNLIININCYE